MQADDKNIERNTEIVARLVGLVLFLVGVGVGYWFVLEPILQAIHGAPFVNYEREATGVAPLAICFGGYILLAGADGMRTLAAKPMKPAAGWVGVISIVLVMLTMFGAEYILNSLGYRR